MDRQYRFDGFNFHNDVGRDQKVNPVAQIDVQSVIGYGKNLLGFEGSAHPGQFMSKTGLVDAFEQSCTKASMYAVGSSQDGRRRASVDETVRSVMALARVLRVDGNVLCGGAFSQIRGQS